MPGSSELKMEAAVKFELQHCSGKDPTVQIWVVYARDGWRLKSSTNVVLKMYGDLISIVSLSLLKV